MRGDWLALVLNDRATLEAGRAISFISGFVAQRE